MSEKRDRVQDRVHNSRSLLGHAEGMVHARLTMTRPSLLGPWLPGEGWEGRSGVLSLSLETTTTSPSPVFLRAKSVAGLPITGRSDMTLVVACLGAGLIMSTGSALSRLLDILGFNSGEVLLALVVRGAATGLGKGFRLISLLLTDILSALSVAGLDILVIGEAGVGKNGLLDVAGTEAAFRSL